MKIINEKRMENLISDDKGLNIATIGAMFSEALEMDATGEYEIPEEFALAMAEFVIYSLMMAEQPEETWKMFREDPDLLPTTLTHIVNGFRQFMQDICTEEGYKVYMEFIKEESKEIKGNLREALKELEEEMKEAMKKCDE